MGWMTNLRILAYCRRAIRALESLAESQRTLAFYTKQRWEESHAPKIQSKANIEFFDPAVASEKWEQEQRLRREMGL